MTRVTSVGNVESKLAGALDAVSEALQDFTDSAYTTHENRERILAMCDKVRVHSKQLASSTCSNTNAVSKTMTSIF